MLIQILYLIPLSLFYIIYFVKMLTLKKKGIAGNLLGKGIKSKKDVQVELYLKTLTWTGASVQFISAFFPCFIWSFPQYSPMQKTGILFELTGVIFFLMAAVTMQNNWRSGFNSNQNTKLVTGAIYKISRNPAFVGFDLLYIGCALVFPNIVNIISTLFALTAFHIQILNEEKFLAEMFGKEYQEYKSKVRRYL